MIGNDKTLDKDQRLTKILTVSHDAVKLLDQHDIDKSEWS